MFSIIVLIIFLVLYSIYLIYSRSDNVALKNLSTEEKQKIEELKTTLNSINLNCHIPYRILVVLNSLLISNEEVTYVSSGNIIQGSLKLRNIYFQYK